ncbi:MAG TPA: alpha/beta hydrolase [Dyella sp.]|uniref:alpha/beta hydrolase n=1 Tax=Dyella sp. TaxID=1869338 RepID=UPI002D76C55F|nr:lysophospholipase [Dyella sp.]HET6553038.1 alpha/beta hydrolase [Dyella sp.]
MNHPGDRNDSHHLMTMADGQDLFVRDWPHARAHGAVLIVHGLGEHSGRYERLAQWFHTRGYAVRCYDQRGHGKTPGPRGALRHADDLLEDLATVYNGYAESLPHPPLLLGHSMGGLVAARCVLDQRIRPPAMVLSSPAMRTWEPKWKQALASSLARMLPNLPLPNGLPFDKLSHDPQVEPAYRNDPLRHGWITPRVATFFFREGEATIRDASQLSVPTLLLVAGADKLVNPSGSRDFAAAAWASNHLTTRYFDSLYHELFNEAEPSRSQVLKQLGDWLQKRA